MRIANNVIRGFNSFELDTNAVGLRSTSATDIKLPYSGELPEHMRPVQSAYVYLNVQLIQGVRLVLVTDSGKGKEQKRFLEASGEEIIALLDSFFGQERNATGLEDYWLGVWQTHYIEWKKFTTGPDRLLEAISTLSDQDKRFLQKHIMDRAAAV